LKRTKKRSKRAKTVTTPRFRTHVFARLASAVFLLLIVILLPQLSATFSSPNDLRAASALKAKNNYAVIAGTVWGPNDHPVYGVLVKIRPAKDKKPKWQVYSDHMGEFAQRVPTGESDYFLTADLKGFKTTDGRPLRLVKEVTVHIYNDEREDTGLHLTVDEPASDKTGVDKAGAPEAGAAKP
jgi:hypothetical protein